ncbi:TlpA disulfide reductase family protein [Hymenobacter sp. NBH84]|uniref:TlpA family protein disulfide reductase n=1 Tax=Hymenobacter sp. NBH84 TaxID=2596915 RepID=UPI001627ADC6|nr:TlpA disulfide reductase family protein [Hymenobacter sp. NBH84]
MPLSRSFFLLGVFMLLLSAPIRAQQRILYQAGNDGQLLTKAQVDAEVQQLREKMKANNMGAYVEVKDRVLRHDTVVYRYGITLASLSSVAEHEKREQLIGQPLPAFSLRDLNGKLITSASLQGKPVVLNFWFTTCAGCISEMPALNEVMAAPNNKGITFLALTYEKPEKVRDFLQKRAFAFQHLPAAQAYCDLFTQAYPITVFVDKQGIIRSIQGQLPYIGPAVTQAQRVLAADGTSYLDATDLYHALDEIR